MTRSKITQTSVMLGLAGMMCLSAAGVKRYRASASAGSHESVEVRAAIVSAPNPVSPHAPATRPPLAAPQSGGGGGIGPMIVFTVYDAGIMPDVAHAPAGTLMIMIRDLSPGTTGLNIAGQVVNGTISSGSNGLSKVPTSSGTVTLSAGTYTVTDMSRPGNTATLIVQ
jgi:hypothetical protein